MLAASSPSLLLCSVSVIIVGHNDNGRGPRKVGDRRKLLDHRHKSLRRRRQRNLLNQISLLRWLNRHRRLTKKPLECLQSPPITPNDHALNSYWANMSTERSDRKSPFMPRGPQQRCQRVVFIIIIRCTTVRQTTTRHNNKTFF